MAQQRNSQTKKAETAPHDNACSSIKVSARPTAMMGNPLLALQRTIGNQAVNRLLQARTLQAKLTISQPDDVYEQEADRVADQVMRMPDPSIQRTCAPCAAGGPPCPKCEEEKNHTIQRKVEAHGSADDQTVPDDVVRGLGPGRPLDAATRAFFEPRFGFDFSHVRVHTGPQASVSARAVNALAYTVGRDVVFGDEHYAPQSGQSRHLLAHELTHVVQQGAEVQRGESHRQRTDTGLTMEQRVRGSLQPGGQSHSSFPAVRAAGLALAREVDAGVPEADEEARGAQVECVKRLGGCPNTRPGGIPTPEEIASYNAQCRSETGYTGPDVTPTDEECRSSGPPPVTPTTVFMCSKDLERSPVGTHAFFRLGGTGTGHPTYSLEPENRGSDCWQGQPLRDFPDDVNADASCIRTSIALSCLNAQYTAYPIGHYCTWGPNSNTFVGHIARNCGIPDPDPPGWNPGIDASPPPVGTFATSPDTTVWGCETKECHV